jgi:MFS family permease
MDDQRKKLWIQSFGGGALSALLFFTSMIPMGVPAFALLGLCILPVSPLPVAYVGIRNGMKAAVFSLFVGMLFISFSFGPLYCFHYFVFVGLISLVYTYGFGHYWIPTKSMMLGVVAVFAVLALVFLLGLMGSGQSAAEFSVRLSELWLEQNPQLMEQMKQLAQAEGASEQIKKLANDPDALLRLIRLEFIPSLFLLVLLSSWVVGIFLNRAFKQIYGLLPWGEDVFLRWRAPAGLIWVVIAMGAGWFFFDKQLEWLIYPVFRCLLLLYFLHGMCILAFFFHRFQVSTPLRVLGYGVATFFALPGIAGIGFFDYWWEIREKMNEGSGENKEEA